MVAVGASPDEPQIIGIVFPSEQSLAPQVRQVLQAIHPQQFQLQLQRHQYQDYLQQQQQQLQQQRQQQQPQQLQQQQQQVSEEYQPRLDSVKRTFLLKGKCSYQDEPRPRQIINFVDKQANRRIHFLTRQAFLSSTALMPTNLKLTVTGLRPPPKVTGQKLSAYADFGNLWDNTRSLRSPSIRARTQSGVPYQQYSQFGLDGPSGGPVPYTASTSTGDSTVGRNYNLQPGGQSQQLQQQHQQPHWNHRLAGTEEVAMHTPIHSQSAGDYGWKRTEISRWNTLRGMWGKRARAISNDNTNDGSTNDKNNNDNHNHNVNTDNRDNELGHDGNKLEEKFKQELEAESAA